MAKAALSQAASIAHSSPVARGNLGIFARKTPVPVGSDAHVQSGVDQRVDVPSFEQIFIRYAPYILHALPYLGVTEADVEDVCQEVFTTVCQNINRFEGRSSLRTWIYGICLHKVLNYRRAAYRRRERLDPGSEQGVECPQLGDLEQKQTRGILQEALAALEEKKREVFVLYEIEELPMSEIAQALGCPLFTAYSRLYAARRDIKKAVESFMAEDRVIAGSNYL
jgi:RNA polymerase sigma-70 factor (ECF subfamily)